MVPVLYNFLPEDTPEGRNGGVFMSVINGLVQTSGQAPPTGGSCTLRASPREGSGRGLK